MSGSGKSTLVNDILYTVLANKLNGARQVPGRHKTVTGLEHLDKVVHVDQGPIGRTPRSNPATYTGVFDHIRTLFAETTEAKIRGYHARAVLASTSRAAAARPAPATARSRSR